MTPAADEQHHRQPNAVSPASFARVPFAATDTPALFVIVDTEEEFDWTQPFSRNNVGVSAIEEVGRLQTVLQRYAITPTYVIDYPIAATASSAGRLSEMARSGQCHIGAHLHPWVNPPHVEAISVSNSYACNLGFETEREKLTQLKQAIVSNLGVTPRVFKAGRYGFGRTTADLLELLDFDVDVSINPRRDYRFEGGPSFEAFEPVPAFFGQKRQLLELPCTTAFTGFARRIGSPLHRMATTRWLIPVRAEGILSRSGMVSKLMLSPEGYSFEEMQELTDTLYGDGVRTFSLTLHSPSLKPGCTPYVRTVRERDAFVATIDRFCDYFLGRFGGVSSTPLSLYDRLCKGAI